jgi:hypothetical protein
LFYAFACRLSFDLNQTQVAIVPRNAFHLDKGLYCYTSVRKNKERPLSIDSQTHLGFRLGQGKRQEVYLEFVLVDVGGPLMP